MKKRSLIFISIIAYIMLAVCIVRVKTTLSEIDKVTSTFNYTKFDVDAKACIFMNCDTSEILYQKNMNQPLLPASITKLVTCLTVLENINIENYILITDEMVNTVGSKIYLMKGDYVKIEDLLYGLMLNSGNDAAKALALSLTNNEIDFIHLMNKLAKKVGMTNSNFNNPSGLDDENANYTTAYDMAKLVSYGINNKSFIKIIGTKSKIVKLENHNLYFHHKHKLVQNYDYVIGGKTGYTKNAGRTLVTIYEYENQKYVVVTLDCNNDWKIHQYFYNSLFTKNNSFNTYFEILTYLLPSPQRLKGKKDD